MADLGKWTPGKKPLQICILTGLCPGVTAAVQCRQDEMRITWRRHLHALFREVTTDIFLEIVLVEQDSGIPGCLSLCVCSTTQSTPCWKLGGFCFNLGPWTSPGLGGQEGLLKR